MALRCWKCGSANEEAQRLAVQTGEFLKLNRVHPAFAALTFGDE
jgi:predicted nucleic-acid-binding Zn-ribbon protein